MSGTKQRLTIALDGGTTNTRSRLLREGAVLATARRAVGVRDAVLTAAEHTQSLAKAVRDCIAEVCAGLDRGPDQIVAAGMLTSEVGLCGVPHVLAPAGLETLARGSELRKVPEIGSQAILFVPGVRTPAGAGADGWAEADVMRGEECETLGAWLAMPRSVRDAEQPPVQAFLWPGSHTKLVLVNGAGEIVASHTTLAGELLAALARHTLLAASLPADWPQTLAAEPLEAAARQVERHGLGRAAFLVRIAALTQSLSPDERAAFLLAAVVADDARQLSRHNLLQGGVPVWVGGRQPQRALYTRWLGELHPGSVCALDDTLADEASAKGALAVAEHWERLDARGG